MIGVWARMVQLYGNSSGSMVILPVVNPGVLWIWGIPAILNDHYVGPTRSRRPIWRPYHWVTSKLNSTALGRVRRTRIFFPEVSNVVQEKSSQNTCFCPQYGSLCRGRTWAQWMRKICEGQCLSFMAVHGLITLIDSLIGPWPLCSSFVHDIRSLPLWGAWQDWPWVAHSGLVCTSSLCTFSNAGILWHILILFDTSSRSECRPSWILWAF